jgi:phage-related protein
MGSEILELSRGEEGLHSIQRGCMLSLDVKRMRIDLEKATVRYAFSRNLHVQGTVCAHLFYPRSQKAPDEEFEPLQFRLYDDQFEIRLGVHVARLVFDKFNLPAPLALQTQTLGFY